jgi:hypothetical protein
MSAFSVALGLACGVVVGDAGAGAASAIAGGVGVLSFVAFMAEGFLVAGAGAIQHPVLLRVLHVSPIALAVDAFRLEILRALPASSTGALLGLAAMTLLLFTAAWLAYTRHQSPVGWERARGRGLLVALGVAALLVPAAAASVDYRDAESLGRGYKIDAGRWTTFSLVEPGTPVSNEALTIFHTLRTPALVFGEENTREILLMPLAPSNATITDLLVVASGGDDLWITGGLDAPIPVADGVAQETKGPGFPSDALGDEHPVYRVPLTLRPIATNALVEGRSLVNLTISYRADGIARVSNASFTVETTIPGAKTQLLLVGAPLPLACVGGLIVRRIRTR